MAPEIGEGAKRFADVLIAGLQLLAVIVGGIWVFFRFRREDTHVPKVAFNIDGTFFGPQQGSYLAELVMSIENKGLVKHRFEEISLRIRGIRRDAPITLWSDTQRVEFPEQIIDDKDVMYKKKYGSIFVEPDVTQRVTYVARIPVEIRFLLVRAQFQYDSHRTHSTEKVFEVKSDVSKSGLWLKQVPSGRKLPQE